MLADRFEQAGERLIAWGILRSGVNVATVTCRACHEDHLAEVEFDREAGAYRHYCPEADWVPVPDEDLRRYRLDLPWLVAWLSRALSVPPNLRPRCLVDDILWYLGEAITGERSWTALFGRRLAVAANRDHLVDALERRTGRAPGVLFTTSTDLGSRIGLPGGHRVLRLDDCLRAGSSGPILDQDVVIGAALAAVQGQPMRTGTPGRPTLKPLYLAEHKRRIASGQAHEKVAAEAEALRDWVRQTHPLEPEVTAGSIENNIRRQHRNWLNSR